MELIEGPTLAERIKQGALPLEEALAIARQIGDALEAAHEKGIIHRDLKPANIKIKPDGTVKVLDFGLAKVAQASAREDPEASPTLTIQGTVAGQILGTAAYMAPEQARGQRVDKRADIWAFGVVLYEMLTGRRLFGGETVSDTLAGVLAKEPEWERVPMKAQRLLKSRLEKDPKSRLRDIADAWRLLEDPPRQTRTSALQWKMVAGTLTLALAVCLWALWRIPRSAETTQSQFTLNLDLGPNIALQPNAGPAVIISPDSKRLVFVSQDADGMSRLFRRQLDQPTAVRIPGTERAYAPFFSPDGQWVGFFAQGKLKKIQLEGTQPMSLCDAPSGRGASWGDNGVIIAALDPQKGLSVVAPERGTVVPLAELGVGENSHRWPQILPGSKAALISVSMEIGNFDRSAIGIIDLKNGAKKILLQRAGMYPRYVPGHLVYVSKGMLYAMPFDLDRLEVRGAPTAVHEISSNSNVGSAQLEFTRNGMLVYRSGRTETLKTLQWLEADGKTTMPLWPEVDDYFTPALSPDGARLTLQVNQESGANLWSYDLQRRTRTRFTNGIIASSPIWSPDGRFVVFRSATGMAAVRADGSGSPQPLTEGRALQVPGAFTPNGTRLVYMEKTNDGGEIRSAPVQKETDGLRLGKSSCSSRHPHSASALSFLLTESGLRTRTLPPGFMRYMSGHFPARAAKCRFPMLVGACLFGRGMAGNSFIGRRTIASWLSITR